MNQKMQRLQLGALVYDNFKLLTIKSFVEFIKLSILAVFSLAFTSEKKLIIFLNKTKSS